MISKFSKVCRRQFFGHRHVIKNDPGEKTQSTFYQNVDHPKTSGSLEKETDFVLCLKVGFPTVLSREDLRVGFLCFGPPSKFIHFLINFLIKNQRFGLWDKISVLELDFQVLDIGRDPFISLLTSLLKSRDSASGMRSWC